jgi:hypothetical protein
MATQNDQYLQNDEDAARELMSVSAEVFGGAGAAGLGLVAGGPAGAVVGGAVGPVIAHALRAAASAVSSLLGRREKARIGRVLVLASAKIEANIAAGQQPRADGFLSVAEDGRAPAEEIAEGVLRAAEKDHEERKLDWTARLLANIAFHPEVTRADANLLVRTAQGLSYRQMCLLAILADPGKRGVLRNQDYRGQAVKGDSTLTGVLQEAHQMYADGLLNASGTALLGMKDVCPSKMVPQGIGGRLWALMELWELPWEDQRPMFELLAQGRISDQPPVGS